jgi:hypothetical protein
MKESHIEGVADHNGPESGIYVRKGMYGAVAGVHAGRVLSREKGVVQDADDIGRSGRQYGHE